MKILGKIVQNNRFPPPCLRLALPPVLDPPLANINLGLVNNVFPLTIGSCLIIGGRISCPECRQQHVWTKNWEQRFPRNFYLETEETDDNPKEDVTQERMCSIHRKRITMFCDANNCQVRFYQLEVHSHCATANVRPKSLPDWFLGTAIYCSHRVAIKMKEKFSFLLVWMYLKIHLQWAKTKIFFYA